MDFDEFFRREHDPLLRLCWALPLDRERARDITLGPDGRVTTASLG